MQTAQKYDDTINISGEKLLSLVNQMFGGADENPNSDEPREPGPFDPLIRQIARKFYSPFPEPWRADDTKLRRAILEFFAARHPEIYDVIGGGSVFNRTATELNPQPLPPRAAFVAALTQEVIDRALLTQEIAEALNQTGERQGIIIVSGRLALLVDGFDELCPRIPRKFRKPKGSADDRFSAFELLTAGVIFEQNAQAVVNDDLRQELRNAGAKLIENGIARI